VPVVYVPEVPEVHVAEVPVVHVPEVVPPGGVEPPTLTEALNTEVELIMKHNVSHHRMNMRLSDLTFLFAHITTLTDIANHCECSFFIKIIA